jgi:CRP/FNR family transcriptional regulator, cyclic AMP receptor protein
MDRARVFEPGEIVIKEGAKDTSAYIILSGSAQVIKHSGGREVIVADLEEGQVFGEMGLIEDRPRSATVRAITELKTRIITREQFNDLLCKRPSVLIPIMKSLFERLRQASQRLAETNGADRAVIAEERSLEVILEGQTSEAAEALGHCKRRIRKFPFLIGRESKNPDTDVFYSNDLFIREQKPYVISRNHLAINKSGGSVWVVDRGSSFGTIVNGKDIGRHSGVTRARLEQAENQVILGPVTSRFIFLLKVVPKEGGLHGIHS